MQDIVVLIELDTQRPAAKTLLPLILSFEGAFAYKEYISIDRVRQDFPLDTSPTLKAAQALFGQYRYAAGISKIAIFGLAADSTPEATAAALTTLRETNDEWYFLLPTVADNDMITTLSTWVDATVLYEAQIAAGGIESEKLLVVQTADKAAITTPMQSLRQTVVCYNHDAANSYLAHAWVGRVAPNYPTAVTWKWKQLDGIPVTNELGTDLHELLEGRYNLYISNHGREYTSEGICTDGDFIDTVIGRWQIKQAMREYLTNLMVDNEVIPYDDQGFALVGSVVISALNEATANGIILSQNGVGAFTVRIPTRADATELQAANRIMPDIVWEATLRGGVHGMTIRGTLTVSLITAATE